MNAQNLTILPRKIHNHEPQHSRGIERRRDKEQNKDKMQRHSFNNQHTNKTTRPRCLKLTMSLVNVSLTLTIQYGVYANISEEEMWVAFAFAKTTHIFF